jgi:hypothetical protein
MSSGVAGRNLGAATLVAGILALVAATVALADSYTFRYTAADQAAARAAVIRRADLGTTAPWQGGPKKADLSPLTCPNYHPKQSDLVVTGAAAANWGSSGVEFDSQALVLRDARMVALDWRRSITPALTSCFRSKLAGDPSAKLISFGRIAFAHVAAYTAAYRAILDVVDSGTTVRVMVDVVAVGRGRTEITLSTTAPYLARAAVVAAEVRLARLLVARAAT